MVRAQVGLDPLPADPDDRVDAAVAATNAWASRLPHAPADPADAEFVLGCTILAARWYKRKATPEGVGTFGADVAVYVPRRDGDVDALLRVGVYAPPRVG
jgi:hypothetical protein